MPHFYIAMGLVWPALGIVALGAAAYFARRYVRAVELRDASEAELADLRQRLLQLEEVVDGTRGDIERIEAVQEFTGRLLAGRPPAPGERATTRGAADARP